MCLRCGKTLILSVVMAAWLACPPAAFCQDQSSLPLPRNNVKAGAVGARRPGNWISAAIGYHIERQNLTLKAFGGATFSPPDPTDLPPRKIFLAKLAESLSATLKQLTLLFTTALQASTATLGP